MDNLAHLPAELGTAAAVSGSGLYSLIVIHQLSLLRLKVGFALFTELSHLCGMFLLKLLDLSAVVSSDGLHSIDMLGFELIYLCLLDIGYGPESRDSPVAVIDHCHKLLLYKVGLVSEGCVILHGFLRYHVGVQPIYGILCILSDFLKGRCVLAGQRLIECVEQIPQLPYLALGLGLVHEEFGCALHRAGGVLRAAGHTLLDLQQSLQVFHICLELGVLPLKDGVDFFKVGVVAGGILELSNGRRFPCFPVFVVVFDIIDYPVGAHAAFIGIITARPAVHIRKVHEKLTVFGPVGIYKSTDSIVLLVCRLNARSQINAGTFCHNPDIAVTKKTIKRGGSLSCLVYFSDFAVVSVSVVSFPTGEVEEFSVGQ